MSSHAPTFHEFQDIPRPVAMIVVEHGPVPALIVPEHSHPRAQLAYAETGVFTLQTRQTAWIVPPHRAVWIPGNVAHEMYARGQAVSNRSLYIEADAVPGLPTECCVIEVSGLMRHLLLEAVHIPLLYDEAGRDGRVMRLILDEIVAARRLPPGLPMPRNRRLHAVCNALLDDPVQKETLDEWASRSAMGTRTFTRLFRQETGTTFTLWRQQLLLMEAMRRLSIGASISATAFELGYESPSAFSAMFKRMLGHTPREFMARQGKKTYQQ